MYRVSLPFSVNRRLLPFFIPIELYIHGKSDLDLVSASHAHRRRPLTCSCRTPSLNRCRRPLLSNLSIPAEVAKTYSSQHPSPTSRSNRIGLDSHQNCSGTITPATTTQVPGHTFGPKSQYGPAGPLATSPNLIRGELSYIFPRAPQLLLHLSGAFVIPFFLGFHSHPQWTLLSTTTGAIRSM